MAKLPIVTVGDPVLEQRAEEVPKITKKVAKLIDDMLETMYEANGVGLAAPQVGVSQRSLSWTRGTARLSSSTPS